LDVSASSGASVVVVLFASSSTPELVATHLDDGVVTMYSE
jgi:hypothetical protein